MSSSTLEIQFYNQSYVQWSADKNGNDLVPGTNSVVTWPSAPLLPGAGYAVCQVSQNLDKLGAGSSGGSENYLYFCWNDGTWRFGVQIQIPFQFLDMGDRPDWKVMYDQDLDSSDINWMSNGSDPGVQYGWPDEIGYSI